MKPNLHWVNLGLLGCIWLIWGYSWTLCKILLGNMGPFQVAFISTAIAWVTLGLAMLLTRRSFKPTPFWPSFWLGMTITAGFKVFAMTALLAGGVGKVTILAYTMPVWTLIMARLFLNEHLRRDQAGCVLLALAGLVLLLEPWSLHSNALSTILALSSGLTWAISIILGKRLYARQDIDTLSLTFWQMFWGMIPLGLLDWWVVEIPTVWSTPVIVGLLYQGVLGLGLCLWIWLFLLTRLKAGVISLNVLAVPVLALCSAWFFLGEVPRAVEGAGMALIGLALAWLTLGNRQRT